MEKIIKQLKEQLNIRTNLSDLRKRIKDDTNKEALYKIVEQDDAMWISFLQSEDAKTRKNAALLLGDLEYDNAKEALWDAYTAEEGCLSLLGGPKKTKRYKKIKVSYQTADFKVRLKTFEGWTAQIIQHEIDHCNGILI